MRHSFEKEEPEPMNTFRRVPQHIGIIMDGNRRWADAHGVSRIDGHKQGIQALRRTVEAGQDLGIRVITAYAFSSENWKRPEWEVKALFELFGRFLVSERSTLLKKGVRLSVIGRRDRMPARVRRRLEQTEALTAEFDQHHLRLAVDYGGRTELAAAARKLAERVRAGELDPAQIDEQSITRALNGDVPDPDLIIRTAGEQRLSNFLPWQSCYSELHFTPTLWPDFGREDLELAIADFAGRERRYGGRPDETPALAPLSI